MRQKAVLPQGVYVDVTKDGVTRYTAPDGHRLIQFKERHPQMKVKFGRVLSAGKLSKACEAVENKSN